MTVSELIEALGRYSGDLPVAIEDPEYGPQRDIQLGARTLYRRFGDWTTQVLPGGVVASQDDLSQVHVVIS